MQHGQHWAIICDHNHGQGQIGGPDSHIADHPGQFNRGRPGRLERQVVTCVKQPGWLLSPSRNGFTMNAHRAMRGIKVPSSRNLCSRSEAAFGHEDRPSEHEHHRARGAFGGMLFGVIAAPILIIPGILLCLLGWGIFLGIPMILLGILLPIVGPIFGMGEHKGRCPSCGTRMISFGNGKKQDCPVCNARFAIEVQHTVGAGEHHQSG